MDIEAISSTLHAANIPLPARAIPFLLLGVVVVPFLIVAAVFAYGYWKKHRKAPKAPLDTAAQGPVGAAMVDPKSLRQAWRRWTQKLPGSFQRSILNFDHYVLLGAPSSGKSKLVDTYTDWRRQAKQLPGAENFDAALPVYLGSGAVITEISGRILEDHGRSSKTALEALWKPLYKHRTPTVLVVVDASRLKEGAVDAVEELAESLRSKINLLSSIRGRALQVRIVLTHLDAFEGYAEFADFCKTQSIETRFPLGVRSADAAEQFEAWLEAMRAQLPRALVHMPTTQYLKVVCFLRSVPELGAPLDRFTDALFAKEALARQPVPGGVYLASDIAGVANPLRAAEDHGPGPDPRRTHMVFAAAATAVIAGYFLFAYREQRAVFVPARAALDQYVPAINGGEREHRTRGSITDFAYKKTGWFDTHPGYFDTARLRVREQFSERVRQELFVPQLRRLASATLPGDTAASPTRRSLYAVALIHSDKHDALKILEPGRLDLWSKMTEIPADIIRDYLRSTDTAYRTPIEFDLAERDVDIRDSIGFWLNFLRNLQAEMATGVMGPVTLRELQAQAERGGTSLSRFDQDDITKTILDQLDIAAGTASVREKTFAPLRLAYLPKYAEYQSSVVSYDVYGQRDRLRSIVRTIRSGSVDAAGTKLLRVFTDRVARLYADPTLGDEEIVKIHLGTEDFTFDPQRWRQVIRDSSARQLVVEFISAGASEGDSIFFGPAQLSELRPLEWNPSNDGSSFFTGKASIDGPYTHVAYEKHVRDVAVRLEQVLEKAKVPDDQQLREFVRDHVRQYATEYRAQTVRFIASFGIRAASPEALRVTIEQMQYDGSSFNDFLVSVDQNTRVETPVSTLVPMRDAMADFHAWHSVVVGDGGAAEVIKYRAILKQLLADLTPPPSLAGAAAGESGGPNDTLEKALSPVGRVALADLQGDKGAYASLVSEWLRSVHLPDYQRTPFLAPIDLVSRIGRSDVQETVRRVWERDMLPDVQRIAHRFPFDRESREEATPRELEAAFHPQTGRFFDLFRRYLEPLTDISGGPFREKRSVSGRVKLPAELYPATNAVASLAATLWDAGGAPRLLETQIATVPFEHGRNPRLALTLVYLNAGAAAVFNFNQKPSQLTVRIPWNMETNSQVGVQLTDIDAKENAFPEPIAVEGAHFSLLRLLTKGAASPIKQPANGLLYTWTVTVARGGTDKIAARFIVIGDPFAPFKLGRFAQAKVAVNTAPASN